MDRARLARDPLDLWQANTFWPNADTLAFSDALVGYAPAGLVGQESPHAALVVYNLLFLGAYGLAFLGAYLLARELGVGRLGAVAAGVAFAYAPWKLSQNGHLHVLSSGGIPLALFLLLRGYRLRRRRLVLGGWLVAAWQMTLGFSLGLQFAYLLLVLGAIAVLALALRAVPVPDRRVMAATVIGIGAFAIAAGLMARPYLRVLDEHPEARRTPAYVETFSPELRSFLAAPAQSWLWGDASHRARAPLPAPDEMSLFPGLAISLLAVLGVLGSVLSRPLRIGLALGVVVCAVLSLGVRDASGLDRYLTPYRFLFDFAPGWDGVAPRAASTPSPRSGWLCSQEPACAFSSATSVSAPALALQPQLPGSPSSARFSSKGSDRSTTREPRLRRLPCGWPRRHSSIFRQGSTTTSSTATGRRRAFRRR